MKTLLTGLIVLAFAALQSDAQVMKVADDEALTQLQYMGQMMEEEMKPLMRNTEQWTLGTMNHLETMHETSVSIWQSANDIAFNTGVIQSSVNDLRNIAQDMLLSLWCLCGVLLANVFAILFQPGTRRT